MYTHVASSTMILKWVALFGIPSQVIGGEIPCPSSEHVYFEGIFSRFSIPKKPTLKLGSKLFAVSPLQKLPKLEQDPLSWQDVKNRTTKTTKAKWYFNLKGRPWENNKGETIYFNSIEVWRVETLGAEIVEEEDLGDPLPE